MKKTRIEIGYWLAGLAIFGCLIAASVLLPGDAQFGITDHQSAGSALRVDEIQAEWNAQGLRPIILGSMVGDLVFIAVYSFGAWRAGRSLGENAKGWMSVLARVIVASALVFCAADYVETVLQLVQMIADRGVDWMASTAAFAQPIKMAAWIVSFVGVLIGLGAVRFSEAGA